MCYPLYIETAPDDSHLEDGQTLEFDSESMRDDLRLLLEESGADVRIPDDDKRAVADGGQDLDQLPTSELVLRALKDQNDQEGDGVPTDDIHEWISARADISQTVIDNSIDHLERFGKIYQSSEGSYRRTDAEGEL